MMEFIQKHKIDLLLAVLALVVHGAIFILMIQAHGGSVLDTVRVDDGYYELSENILAGNGFSWDSNFPYRPNPLRTPGYSYTLAALIAVFGVTGAAIVQLIVSSSIPLLGRRIAAHIARSPQIGVVTGIILALDPTLARLSFQFYTDSLFIILFFLWLLLSFRYMEKRGWQSLVLGAVILGFATLVRPISQYMAIIFPLFILWQCRTHAWRTGIMQAGTYVLIVGIIISPWIVRNINTFDTPGLSAQAPFILYTNLAPAVLSVANRGSFIETRDAFLTYDEYKGNAITLANRDVYTAKALEIVKANPMASAFVMAKAAFTIFTHDGLYSVLPSDTRDSIAALLLIVTARLFWIMLIMAAAVGSVVSLLRKPSLLVVFCTFLIIYFALTHVLVAFGANPRYRLPIDPILIAFAGIGLVYLNTHIKRLLAKRSIN